MPRVFPDLDPQIDDGSQGTDDADQPGGIQPVDQCPQVCGKWPQNDGCRYIGNNLADADAPPVFVPGHMCPKKACHSIIGG